MTNEELRDSLTWLHDNREELKLSDETIKRIESLLNGILFNDLVNQITRGIYEARKDTYCENIQYLIEDKKGFWEYVDDVDYRCSVCHKYAYGCLGEVLSGQYKYCPYCGARMEYVNEGKNK